MKLSTAIPLCLLVAGICVAAWLKAVRDSQLRPHLITQSINGRVFNSFLATNPMYVAAEWQYVPTTNGFEYRTFPKTNYYWKVWRIFQ